MHFIFIHIVANFPPLILILDIMNSNAEDFLVI